MKYDAIIVGGGIAGLTAATYLTKNGYQVLLCEKEDHVGGLVNSFTVDGFLYDAGARGIVDSGIVKPFLSQLGITVEFAKNVITIGIEDQFVRIESVDNLADYREMLVRLYPESELEIDAILLEIRKIMDYMDVLYGIENPLFKDLKNDKEYLLKSLLPWLVKKIKQGGKLKQYQDPVDQYLRKLTNNQALSDIISQHFFQKTPASFALSYFSLYMDYQYPVHGTLDFVKQIEHEFLRNKGTVLTSTKIAHIDVGKKQIQDDSGQLYEYDELIWAADQNQLYQAVDNNTISSSSVRKAVENRKQFLLGKRGGDSIFTLFLAVDLDQDYFRSRSSGHCFYTPSKIGQAQSFGKLNDLRNATDKEQILSGMNEFLKYTTYEISIPSLRNPALAPAGKTGLIVSFLMEYDFIKNIRTLGFYDEFKHAVEIKIIDILNSSIYPGINEKVLHHFSSSPLTIEKLSGNYDGAITGWAFTNPVIPSVTKTARILKTCLTPIPSVLQAGQWTFSPSGLPISILTGKIAADAANKLLKKRRKK